MFGGVVVALFIALAGTMAEHGGWVRLLGPTVCYAQDEGDPGAIKGNGCPTICGWVTDGSLAWIDALLLFGCYCGSGGSAPAVSPVMLSVQMRGVLP